MAGVLQQMGTILQEHKKTRSRSFLQGVLHLPELRPPHPVHDIHDELDRASPEGLPQSDEDARGDARRGVCSAPDGQDHDGQEVLSEAGAQNRP